MPTRGVAGSAASCLCGHFETSVRPRPALGTLLSPPAGLQSFPVCLRCFNWGPQNGPCWGSATTQLPPSLAVPPKRSLPAPPCLFPTAGPTSTHVLPMSPALLLTRAAPSGPQAPFFPHAAPVSLPKPCSTNFPCPAQKSMGLGGAPRAALSPEGLQGKDPAPNDPSKCREHRGTGQQDLQCPRDGAGVHGLHLNNPSTARLHSQSFHPEPRSHLAAEPSAPLCL